MTICFYDTFASPQHYPVTAFESVALTDVHCMNRSPIRPRASSISLINVIARPSLQIRRLDIRKSSLIDGRDGAAS